MINLEDLWIGDTVKLIKSQRIGRFVGLKNGKARVEVDGKFFLASAKNLLLVEEKTANNKLAELHSELNRETRFDFYQEKQNFPTDLDLHIEKLQKEKSNDPPAVIVEFQLRKLREYIENAIRLKIDKVTIIHGKGEGVLSYELNHLIKNYKEIVSQYPTNNGGATILYFRY